MKPIRPQPLPGARTPPPLNAVRKPSPVERRVPSGVRRAVLKRTRQPESRVFWSCESCSAPIPDAAHAHVERDKLLCARCVSEGSAARSGKLPWLCGTVVLVLVTAAFAAWALPPRESAPPPTGEQEAAQVARMIQSDRPLEAMNVADQLLQRRDVSRHLVDEAYASIDAWVEENYGALSDDEYRVLLKLLHDFPAQPNTKRFTSLKLTGSTLELEAVSCSRSQNVPQGIQVRDSRSLAWRPEAARIVPPAGSAGFINPAISEAKSLLLYLFDTFPRLERVRLSWSAVGPDGMNRLGTFDFSRKDVPALEAAADLRQVRKPNE
ncbi:MAG TPA: hypothetical protein VEJ63_22940 [Planctomycetota bacterium]|nr:hypothetical protein [Planctomycetota bacterium]